MAKERGLAPGVIDTVPELYRKAVITDPEGTMSSPWRGPQHRRLNSAE